MAIAGIGLAAAAAAPASAQYGGSYGPGNAGAFGDYGYDGVYSYGWPYATYGLAGYGGSGNYGFGGSYGAAYGAAVSAPYRGWGTGYAYYGWAPSYGYAGYPLNGRARNRGFGRGAYRVIGYGYGVGDRPLYGHAFAAAKKRHFDGTQSKIVYRAQNLELARVD